MAEPKPRSPTVMKGVALLLGRGTSAVVADGNEKVDVAEISKPLRWRVAKDPPFELPWKRREAFFFFFIRFKETCAFIFLVRTSGGLIVSFLPAECFGAGHGSTPGLRVGTGRRVDHRLALLPRLVEHGAAGVTCVGTG